MRCEQAGEMMSAWLDGYLDDAGVARLENHLAGCGACRAEWRRMQALDRLLVSAQMVPAPSHLSVRIATRINRREQARRAIVGGTVLALSTVTLALLVLAPALLGMLETLDILPALISGGPETLAQLIVLLRAMGHALLVLLEHLAMPLALLSLGSLAIALALNGLWIGAMHRLQAAS